MPSILCNECGNVISDPAGKCGICYAPGSNSRRRMAALKLFIFGPLGGAMIVAIFVGLIGNIVGSGFQNIFLIVAIMVWLICWGLCIKTLLAGSNKKWR